MTDDAQAYFTPPSLEGAQLALEELDGGKVDATRHCAVAIDVFNRENILIQRALAHAEVPAPIRDAFRELVDRSITRFADAQDLDARPRGAGGPYRGGMVDSNELAGFDCGYALAVARGRVAKLRASLQSGDDLVVRLFGVPFLVARITRGRSLERAVIMRQEDGGYVYESVAPFEDEEADS